MEELGAVVESLHHGRHGTQQTVMEPGVGWENIHKTEDVSDRLFMQDRVT